MPLLTVGGVSDSMKHGDGILRVAFLRGPVDI